MDIFRGYKKCFSFLIACFLLSLLVSSAQASLSSKSNKTDLFHSYCGIQVLKQSFQALNIPSNQAVQIFWGLKQAADHHYGYNTFTELKKAAQVAGLHVSAVKSGIAGLKGLLDHGQVVVNTTGNRHFCLLKNISPKTVTLYIPGVKQEIVQMRWEEFAEFWDGSALMISRSVFKLKNARGAYKELTHAELDHVRGGDDCANINGGSFFYSGVAGSGPINITNSAPIKNNPSQSGARSTGTSDPVNIINGDIFLTKKDISFPARGQAVNLTRYYNTEAVSEVLGWTPDPGAGTWAVKHGVYDGQGDRVTTNATYQDLILNLDMQTITPGAAYAWEVAWVHIRYTPSSANPRMPLNSYYFLIHTDGMAELSKWTNGTQYFLTSAKTSLVPTQKNHIQIAANGAVIQVSVNGNLVINFTDPSPLLSAGKVALESYFCHAQFSNVTIQSGNTTNSYTFNTDDNQFIFGYGWTHSYALRIAEYSDHITLFRENNAKEIYALQSDGTYKSFPINTYDTLTKDSGGYTLKTKKRLIYRFGTNGRLRYVQDFNGNQVTLTDGVVNSNTVLTNIQDPSGRKIVLTYGTNGMVSKATDPAGNSVQYAYDANNHLIRVTDRIGRTTQYTYDPLTDNLLSIKDPSGNVYQYNYTYNDRINIQTDPLGQQTQFSYFWDTIDIINKNGATYKYNFNTSSFLNSVTDPLNQIQTYANDANGNVLTYTDKDGHNTNWTYDANGNTLTSTDTAGGVTTRTYDNILNLPISVTDPVGNTTTFQYDSKGNLIELTYPN